MRLAPIIIWASASLIVAPAVVAAGFYRGAAAVTGSRGHG